MKYEVEVMQLVDELDEILDNAQTSLLSSDTCKVNKSDIKNITSRIREILPEEIKQATWVNKERARLIDEAKADAQKLYKLAEAEVEKKYKESDEEIERLQEQNRQYLEDFYAKSGPIKEAKRRAEVLISDAENEAAQIREGALRYAKDILDEIEMDVGKLLNDIIENKAKLEK